MSVKPKKSLGQNFLNDPNTVSKIVRHLQADKNDQVIEIGPGTGVLTKELIKKYEDLTVIEIDDRLSELLHKEFPSLRIVQKDVLKTDWLDIIVPKKQVYVIGNLPYYITSPILFSLLDNHTLFKGALLMMQKEVAKRLIAIPRTKDYGIMSVQVQLMSTVKYEFTVPRNVFHPVPKVDSAIVSFTFDKRPIGCELSHLKTVVRTAFNQRRKKLRNALKSIIPKDYDFPIDLNRRAEELKPREFEDLTILLEEIGLLSN